MVDDTGGTADLLIRQAPDILRRWETRVRQEIPGSREQKPLVLRNNLQALLLEVAKALTPSGVPEVRIAGQTLSEDHGGHRATLNTYSLGEVFLEYRLLRQTILEVLDEERRLPADEREVINTALERAVQEAVTEFAHVRVGTERARGDAADAVAQALKEADVQKNQFLGLLAHEIRTPLSAMTNAIYILEHIELEDPRALRQLQSLERQTLHLSRLTEDILDITRVVQGKIELRPVTLDLRGVASDAVETSRVFIEARGQELSVSFGPHALWVEGDPVRLTQVLTNLLNNAAKFTEPGGRIWLSAERNGDEVVVTIRDTGIGVPAALLPQIFDMFAQADPKHTQSRGGLGMGLSVVRRLVELHHGTVTAGSLGDGEGTEFVVHLPQAAPPPEVSI